MNINPDLPFYFAHVYILTNLRHTVFYIGVTSNIRKRMQAHKERSGSKFANQYNVHKLIYLEGYGRIEDAIHREKQLKKWRKKWKHDLISEFNPKWIDLTSLVLDW